VTEVNFKLLHKLRMTRLWLRVLVWLALLLPLVVAEYTQQLENGLVALAILFAIMACLCWYRHNLRTQHANFSSRRY
jgi:hypothetical protein